MTLILSELSQAGIAMAADSTITFLKNSKVEKQTSWQKLFRVPRINAGVSYWGNVGEIVTTRFDEWLDKKLKEGSFTDLPALADYLALYLNKAAGNKPITGPAGIHVAGYHRWSADVRMPTLFHIHNGHGHIRYATVTDASNGVQTIRPEPVDAPRELFSRHDDFFKPTDASRMSMSLSQGAVAIWRNGDYSVFEYISKGLDGILKTVAAFPGISVASNSPDIGRRVAFLKTQIEITVAIYRLSSLRKTIGAK